MWFIYFMAGLAIFFVILIVAVGIWVWFTDDEKDTRETIKSEEEKFCPHVWQLIDLQMSKANPSYESYRTYLESEKEDSKYYVYQCIVCNKKKTVHESIKEEFEALFTVEDHK